MPLFRVPKKLSKPLGAKLEQIESVDPEREWFADLFHVERKKAVIWVQRTTLLTFVRPTVTVAELDSPLRRLEGMLARPRLH